MSIKKKERKNFTDGISVKELNDKSRTASACGFTRIDRTKSGNLSIDPDRRLWFRMMP